MRRGFLIACIVLVVAIGAFFPRAGEFLIAQDAFYHVDTAVVLSGLPISRSFAARDLLKQGKVKRVLVIPEPPNKIEGEVVKDRVKEGLIRLGLFDPSQGQWAVRILLAGGIPDSQISVLPEWANGTITEARLVKRFLDGRAPKSLVLVTSKSASRRARLIFRRVFRNTLVQILSYPTPYDPFESKLWWKQPRNALTVMLEYQKLLSNIITLAFTRSEQTG